MGFVLDTSALIALERARSAGRAQDLPLDSEVVLPAVVWAEALIGVRMADSAARAARRRAYLEAIRLRTAIEPFTAEIAEHYADIYAELSAQGALIPQNDVAVAATARVDDLKSLPPIGPLDEPRDCSLDNSSPRITLPRITSSQPLHHGTGLTGLLPH